jgi:hypothetical protein
MIVIFLFIIYYFVVKVYNSTVQYTVLIVLYVIRNARCSVWLSAIEEWFLRIHDLCHDWIARLNLEKVDTSTNYDDSV